MTLKGQGLGLGQPNNYRILRQDSRREAEAAAMTIADQEVGLI